MGVIFSKYRLFVLANMSWPWQLALVGIGDALALATCHSHGVLIHG